MPKNSKTKKKSENGLTMKQENFCREYLLCGNAAEAYRKAYDTKNQKIETVWNSAYKLMKKPVVKARIDQLKQNVEEVTGITKSKMIGTLQEVIGRSLQKVPVMEFDPIQKEMRQKIDEKTGEGVWEYDANGVNRAVDLIMKAMGYYAPAQSQTIGKDGQPVNPGDGEVKINVIKQYDGTDDKLNQKAD